MLNEKNVRKTPGRKEESRREIVVVVKDDKVEVKLRSAGRRRRKVSSRLVSLVRRIDWTSPHDIIRDFR